MREPKSTDKCRLVQVTEALLPQIREYRAAFQYRENDLYGTSGLKRYTDMHKWYAHVQKRLPGKEHPSGDVPSIQFAYVRDRDRKVVGMLVIRTEDTPHGHIGYSVAPNERKNGYGSCMLRDALTYCAEQLNLPEVTVTIAAKNGASQCVARNNEGVFTGFIWLNEQMTATYKFKLKPDEP